MMRVGGFASGGGTTWEAILQACRDGTLAGVEPALLIASEDGIGAIAKARALGMPELDIVVLNPDEFETRKAFGLAILRECHARGIDTIGLYGFLRQLPRNVVEAFEGRSVNQHPAPVPWFGGPRIFGIRPHAAVLNFKQALLEKRGLELNHTFVISQRVHVEFDKGEVLAFQRVEILEGDTAEMLRDRALPLEWETQIDTLRALASGGPFMTEEYRASQFVFPGEEDLIEEAKQLVLQQYPSL